MSYQTADGAVLTLDGVSVSFGRGRARRQVLNGIDLQVERGEIVGLIGETGSGKTTLAKTIFGLVRPARGSVRVAGTDVSVLRGRELRAHRRSGIAQYVFQDSLQSLDPDHTVGASIGEGLVIAGHGNRAAIRARVEAVADDVSLPRALLDSKPRLLSGGQRQRAAIARALAVEAQLLVLDEPVSALDAETRVQVLELLRGLSSERGIAQVFISHDLGSVAGITDRIAVLYRGDLVETGPSEQIIRHPTHPYTQLLVGSAVTIGTGEERAARRELRRALATGATTSGFTPR